MAKEKKSKNTKKPSDSAAKGADSGLTSLIKNVADKVVESVASARKQASSAKKGVKASAGVAPSALTKSGSEPAAPAATPVVAVPVATPVVDDLEVILTDAEGRRYCRATDCDQIGMVDGYCRYHYLYYWKKIQNRKKILADGKLERYIEELTARYSDKFIELLRKDTRTEKDFLAAVQELELDDSASASAQDEDEAKTYLEEISGVATESSARDDEGY